MKIALGCLTSVVLGFLLMIPLGILFTAMNWPLFHTWGLVHGSFIFAWPWLAALAFAFLWVVWLRKRSLK